MMEVSPSYSSPPGRLLQAIVFFVLLSLPLEAAAQSVPASPAETTSLLTAAAQVLRLSREDAARGIPVRITGVVTYVDPGWRLLFIKDETAGIYIHWDSWDLLLHQGDQVEIEGRSHQGGFAPVVRTWQIRILGRVPLPAARLFSFEELATGQEDSQWVEVEGVVRSIEENDGHLHLNLASMLGRCEVFIPQPAAVPFPEHLVDAEVRLQGVCATQFNTRAQLIRFKLFSQSAASIQVVKPAPSDLFELPVQPLAHLFQFQRGTGPGRRSRVSGVVTLQRASGYFFLQDGTGCAYVQTRKREPLDPGDNVEVVGFGVSGGYTPRLEDAV